MQIRIEQNNDHARRMHKNNFEAPLKSTILFYDFVDLELKKKQTSYSLKQI